MLTSGLEGGKVLRAEFSSPVVQLLVRHIACKDILESGHIAYLLLRKGDNPGIPEIGALAGLHSRQADGRTESSKGSRHGFA